MAWHALGWLGLVMAPAWHALGWLRLGFGMACLGLAWECGLVRVGVGVWVGLAWPNTVSGSRPVQINLNLDTGETLISTVVNTAISAGAHAESAGNKMIDAASSVRELALSFAE